MITQDQVAAFAALRRSGASVTEAVVVLSAVAEVDRVGRILDLASDAWRREMRGPKGRWTGGGPRGVMSRAAKEQRRRQIRQAHGLDKGPAHATENFALKAAAQVHQQASAIAQETARTHVTRAMAEIKARHEQFVKQQETTEGHKAKIKAAGMIGSLAAGAVLSLVEAKLGVPDIAQITSAITPGVAEALFELKQRL